MVTLGASHQAAVWEQTCSREVVEKPWQKQKYKQQFLFCDGEQLWPIRLKGVHRTAASHAMGTGKEGVTMSYFFSIAVNVAG